MPPRVRALPQLYLTAALGGRRLRLLGFERVALKPGESRRVPLSADRRLLGLFDGARRQWRVVDGEHEVALSRAADAPVERAKVRLDGDISVSEPFASRVRAVR